MFLAIWSFEVGPSEVERFERAYGPGGDWEQFFEDGEGYLFLTDHSEGYADLDGALEGKAEREDSIGDFDTVGAR